MGEQINFYYIAKRLGLLLLATLICWKLSAQTPSSEKILFNGRIYTANEAEPFVEAVSISGDKIVAVGSLKSVRASVSARAEWIDLQGRSLLPGLIDSHNHAIGGGESLTAATLNDVVMGKNELTEFARTAIQTGKGLRGDVLYVEGVHSSTWVSVSDLNDLFNKGQYISQAVVLRGSDKHTAWVNNAMLNRAGINSSLIGSLPDLERKYFGFDKNFEPNGLISESGYQRIQKVLPPSRIETIVAAETGVKYLNSLGITAWLDPSSGNILDGINNRHLETYRMLSEKKKLTAHVGAVVVADANAEPGKQIDVVRKLQDRLKGVKDLKVLGFKIFADGVMEFPTQTAALSIPYKNSRQNGVLMFDPAKYKTFVTLADKEKLMVHVHAIGDRAVTESLNGFAAARMANGNSSITHSITHLQIVKPEDYKRFSVLNVVASMQLLWANADSYVVDLVKPYIDQSLYMWHYPALSLLKAGATIGGASDWPVSSANPFEAIAMAETRIGQKGVLAAGQVMARMEMIKAYTLNAAKVLMMEKAIGSLEAGKQADLVLVDRDVFSVTSEDVRHTKVVWTMFSGDFVYKR